MKNLLQKTLFLVVFVIFSTGLPAQNDFRMTTPGELTFSVKTVTNNGNFAPKHVLAIWGEDEQGFIKTRKLRANQRKQYLYTWRSVSGDNVTDAITGATLSSHQTHTITWDCTDIDGNIIPDGDYTIFTEFTEKHAQGPITGITFTKGPEEQHLTPADENNFINMTLDFIPETTALPQSSEEKLKVSPNPGTGLFSINLPVAENFKIKVYDSNSKLLLNENRQASSNQTKLDLSNFNSGIYFVEIEQSEKVHMLKLILQ